MVFLNTVVVFLLIVYFCGFIQTQTRIWLGEVLQIRLEEQMTVSDLLADGELLYVLFSSLMYQFENGH